MTDPEGGVHFPIPTHPGREATYLASIEMEGEGQLPLRRIIWKTESFPFPLEVDLQQGMVSPDGLLAFRLRCPEGASVRAELQDEGGTRLGEPFLVEGEGEAWTRAQLPVPKGVSEAVNLVLQPAGMPDDGEAMRVFRLTVRPAPEVDRDAELFLAVPDPEVEAGQPLPLILATTMPGRDALLLGGTRILRHSEVVRLQDALTTASVTAAPDWAPNLHLMALAYKPGEGFIQTGRSRVDVVAVHKRLRVEVLLEREAYRPGDTVRARVRVTDWKGAPVPNASVSLAVVNEDAHILESDPTPPLWKHFYNHSRHWTLRLGKRETLPAIEATLWKSLIRRWGFVDRRARLPSRSGRGRGRFLSRECGHHVYTPPMLDIPNERDNTVFWAADLRTDASGTAHVEFDLPQTRARFRATARAHDDSAAPLLGEGRTMLDVAGR